MPSKKTPAMALCVNLSRASGSVADLARTLAEIASTRVVYHSLAAEASADSREEISEALLKAAELLGKGSTIQHDGDVYMGAAEDFDDLRGQYAETVEKCRRALPDFLKDRGQTRSGG